MNNLRYSKQKNQKKKKMKSGSGDRDKRKQIKRQKQLGRRKLLKTKDIKWQKGLYQNQVEVDFYAGYDDLLKSN